MTKKPHVHHIIPKWRCKELNIDPNFKGNVVITSHEQHIKIHLGYHKKDLKPLLEVCNPSEEILKLLKLGDNNDFKAGQKQDNASVNHNMYVNIFADNNEVKIIGHSGGGLQTLYYMYLIPEIKSGYFSASFFTKTHRLDNTGGDWEHYYSDYILNETYFNLIY